MRSKQNITLSLDGDLVEAIDNAARAWRASRSWIVNSLLRRGLKDLAPDDIGGGLLPVLAGADAPVRPEGDDAR